MRKYFLPSLLFLLMIISLITLKSIAPELLDKQLLAYVLGFSLFLLLSRLNLAYWRKFSPYLYWLLNLILLVLLLVGQVTRGIVAWIQLPFNLRFQPSQLAVPLTALFLAEQLSTLKETSKHLSWPQFFKILLYVAIPAILIILEPDLGTAIVFILALSVFLLFNPLSWQQILALLLSLSIITAGMWLFVLEDYQKSRLTSFSQINQQTELMLETDANQDAAYNARQALIAVGAGQLWGQGLGRGSQSHLKFLPERQTDFIFASFAEEWGFLGSSLILTLYLLLLAFLLYIAINEADQAKQLYVLTVFMMFFVQIFINIGMNLALVPITGITLPFLSYGGSSILSLFFTLALVQRVVFEQEKLASSIFQ